MGLDDIAISFALSYLAGNIPTIKDRFSKKRDLDERIEKCYQKALKRWCQNDSIRKNMSIHIFENTKKLAKYIETENIVIIRELIDLWGRELRNDELCYAFILECKLDGILDIAHNQASILGDINSKIDILLDNSRENSPIRKGLTKHKPVNNYIRRYCSSETDHHESLYYLLRNAERNTLADYVTGVVSHDTNKFILYSGGQTGKTTELRNLCWELQNSGLYIPVSFEVKSSYDLKRDDLPQTRFYNLKEIVIIIDALDEINGKERDELLLTICSFAHDNPDIKMVLSCRGNYRREDIMDDFSTLYLMEMNDYDAQEHINNSLGENNLGKLIYDCGLSEFTRHPFFLNVLIEAYRAHYELPRTRAEVYKLFIEQSYTTETGKPTFKCFESDRDTAIETLERIALAMSLMSKQSLTKHEMGKCLGNETKIQECLRYSIIKFKDGLYSFEHNAFREWLVAFYLYKHGVEKARTFATQPNGRIKPEWYNIIVLWISMYTYQDQHKIPQIIDWLKTASLELLIYADQDTLDETTKDSIFKGILLEYKSLGIRMSSLFSEEYKKMIDFGQSKATVQFIAEELNSAKFGTRYYSDLICLCLFLNWALLEISSKSIFDYLLSVLESKVRDALKHKSYGDEDLTYVYLENDFFTETSYMNRIFAIINDSNNYEAIKAMMGLIYRAKRGNEYVDYILEKENFVRDQQVRGTTYVVSREYVYLSLYSVDSEDGILKVLKHDFHNQYYHQSDWENYARLIQNMLSKVPQYIKNGNNKLAIAVEKSFEVLFGDKYHSYNRIDTADLFLCYRNCYQESGLVNMAKTDFDNKIRNRFGELSREEIKKLIVKTGLWLTPEIIDDYYSEFEPTNFYDKHFAALLNRCPNEEVALIAQNKFDGFFPEEEPSKYQIRKAQLFSDFKDYSVFKQQVLESLIKITCSDVREVRKQLRDDADEIVNDYVFRFVISYVDNNATFSQEAIIRAIKNKECYDDFFMKVVADALFYGTTYEPIDSDCKSRCFLTAKRIVTELVNKSYTGHYKEEALQLMMHGYFSVNEEDLVLLLPYSNVSITRKEDGKFPTSYTLFDYISEKVPTHKLADSVIVLLKQDKTIEDFNLSYNLASYIIDHKVEKGYPILLRKYLATNAPCAMNIVIMMIKANIMIEEIKALSNKMTDSDKLTIYYHLLTERKQEKWINEKLEAQYQHFEDHNKIMALRILVTIGSMPALSYLTSNPKYLIEYQEYNFCYTDVNAVEMLSFILQYYNDNNMNDMFINRSILNSLEQIATMSESNLREVKLKLKELISKHDDFKYLNRYIIEFENKYYRQNHSISNIEEAISIIDMSVPKHDVLAQQEPQREPIYISYNWECTSSYIVDYFCTVLEIHNIPFSRDKKDCNYRDNIKEFMNAIRNGQKIIVVFSEKYLQSKNCMYELTGIMEHEDYKNRIFPVVTDNNIRDDGYYVKLVQYWKSKEKEMAEKVLQVKEIDPLSAVPLETTLLEINKIRKLLAELKNYIDWTNAESLPNLSATQFKLIIDAIQA